MSIRVTLIYLIGVALCMMLTGSAYLDAQSTDTSRRFPSQSTATRQRSAEFRQAPSTNTAMPNSISFAMVPGAGGYAITLQADSAFLFHSDDSVPSSSDHGGTSVIGEEIVIPQALLISRVQSVIQALQIQGQPTLIRTLNEQAETVLPVTESVPRRDSAGGDPARMSEHDMQDHGVGSDNTKNAAARSRNRIRLSQGVTYSGWRTKQNYPRHAHAVIASRGAHFGESSSNLIPPPASGSVPANDLQPNQE